MNLFVVLVCLGTTIGSSEPFPRNADLTYGLNMLFGNPRDPTASQPDWPIFDQTVDDNNIMNWNGVEYSLPSGLLGLYNPGGTAAEKTHLIDSDTEYSNDLSLGVTLSAENPWLSFSGSAKFSDGHKSIYIDHNTMVTMRGESTLTKVSIDTDLMKFSQVFLDDLNNLPKTYESEVYANFLDRYGTHYYSSVNLGATYGRTMTMTQTFYKNQQDKSATLDVTFLKFLGGSLGYTDSNMESTLTKNSQSTEYVLGIEDENQIPEWFTSIHPSSLQAQIRIGGKAEPISSLLTSGVLNRLHCNWFWRFFGLCSFFSDLATIQTNLEEAERAYCNHSLGELSGRCKGQGKPMPSTQCTFCTGGCGGTFPYYGGAFYLDDSSGMYWGVMKINVPLLIILRQKPTIRVGQVFAAITQTQNTVVASCLFTKEECPGGGTQPIGQSIFTIYGTATDEAQLTVYIQGCDPQVTGEWAMDNGYLTCNSVDRGAYVFAYQGGGDNQPGGQIPMGYTFTGYIHHHHDLTNGATISLACRDGYQNFNPIYTKPQYYYILYIYAIHQYYYLNSHTIQTIHYYISSKITYIIWNKQLYYQYLNIIGDDLLIIYILFLGTAI